MSNLPIDLKELIVVNPLPADHPYWERERAIKKRIAAVREFQDKQACHPEMGELSQCKNQLVNLIGPENAAPFLERLESLTSDSGIATEALSVDATFKKYNDGIILQATLYRLIRLLGKGHDNGKEVVENIAEFGEVRDVDFINAIIERLESDLARKRKGRFYHLAYNQNTSRYVMNDVHWNMGGEKYFSRAEFDEAVLQYRLDASISGYWDPAMIAVLSPCIRIERIDWDSEDLNSMLEFKSDNGLWFNEGELLFKIHNAVVEQCNDSDHSFFEGIELHRTQEPGKPPLYCLMLGS